MKTSFRALMVVLVFAVLGMPGVTRSSVSVTAPKISNEEFGRLVESFSELDKGEYGWKNFLSNEQSFASLFPGLTKVAAQGGAYIGVGPEQNFTYIGKLRPEVAFIVDIQRRNMLQILFYKALFEHAETPTQFLELLIARSGNSVEELLKLRGFGDPTMLRKSLGIVYASIKSHGITLSAQDRAVIEEIAGEFALYGGSIHSDTPPMQPTLEDLVLEKDHVGQRPHFLLSPGSYEYVRNMHVHNTIVPVVGNFGGTKALRKVAEFLRGRNIPVQTFYVSSVEYHIYSKPELWANWLANIQGLPWADKGIVIRAIPYSHNHGSDPQSKPGYEWMSTAAYCKGYGKRFANPTKPFEFARGNIKLDHRQ